MNFSTFPDCSICKCLADDGGWLDNKNYRFWICIDCDDYLDTIERKKMSQVNIGEIVAIHCTGDRSPFIGEVVAFNSDGVQVKNKQGHYYFLYMEIEFILPYS
jgi:hypothetical protein